jgi:hypothetical protein
MKALVSFKSNGRYADLGSCYRMIVSLKTKRGINRRADTYKRPYRVELFNENNFYGEPFEIYYGGQQFDGDRP